MNDTIAAIATPYGSGGIGVIRISGPESFNIADQIFSRKKDKDSLRGNSLASHTVCHGYILNDAGEAIDEVLLIPMRGPKSYTAEDVVEIQAHSGTLVLRSILDIVLSKGARISEPGEFTRRAFLNQRIDLTQAEAVADIINARSERALKFAASQNLGTLKNEILSLRETLIALLSIVEVAIDFPEDEDAGSVSEKDLPAIEQVIEKCREFIQQHNDACFLKEGIRIAICGQPNVGKSSLMNRLLNQEKSIVTALPGTTRDPIEEGLNLDGIPFVIVDTAGIHDTGDLVEIIGIEKAKDHIRDADLVLFMKEPGTEFTEREFLKTVPQKKRVILVINKMDLARKNENNLPLPPSEYSHIPVVKISALLDQGIRELKGKIVNLCIQDLDMEDSAVIPNLRHKKALEESVGFLESAKKGIKARVAEETLAIDIKNSIDALGTITGETAPLDILDTIFSNFCIGK